MQSNVICVLSVFAFLAVIKNSCAIQCWECTSDAYGRCADHFNTTLFPRNAFNFGPVAGQPHVRNCDTGPSNFGQYGYQRQVCVKRVETDRRLGRTTYSRQCHTLVGNERVGSCPTYTTNPDIVVDFCEYCDTHECNGAEGISRSAFWLSLLPIAFALALRERVGPASWYFEKCRAPNIFSLVFKMGVRFQFIILPITLIYGIVHVADAMYCWECQSDTDPRCADPFDNRTFTIRDCSVVVGVAKRAIEMRSTMCQKIKRKEDGVWKVIRKCAYGGDVGTHEWNGMSPPEYGPNNLYTEYYNCQSRDGCNTSIKVFATLWSVVLTVIPFVVA
ncbi:hypothetical protein FQR65_LT01852 [Abscondita terminalis]|nr:hypothetical protein FQR65_LT01852 [Abscondita terminalis]